MKRGYLLLFMVLYLITYQSVLSQTSIEKAGRIENGRFILAVDLSWNKKQQSSFASRFDVDTVTLKHLFVGDYTFISDSSDWELKIIRPGLIELSKKLQTEAGAPAIKMDALLSETYKQEMVADGFKIQPNESNYGINDFRNEQSFRYSNGRACFFLFGKTDARKVFLAGSFNNWSTMNTQMEPTGRGWICCLKMPPGKYTYKFIVDGRWMHDPENRIKEEDGQSGYNSVAYCYNYTFNLNGYTDAKNVIVTGSFNGWNEKELKMTKTMTGWSLPVFIREGTHAYKFIVDGIWINDPANKVIRPDGKGNFNSFMGIGDTLIFQLKGAQNAKNVILTGSFNAWNEGELFMKNTADGWQLPYVLSAGNYEYKFIVDGKWVVDSLNPFFAGSDPFLNSFVAFKPNHTFILKENSKVKDVRVTGTFNGWSNEGYRMVQQEDTWIMPIYLKPGRYSYKFIVDGQWILDEANPLWEENEFGTDNSVLWIE